METQDICPVCMENREEIKCNAIVLNCSHFVCIDCITQLLKYRITTCPLCRIDFIKCLANIVDVGAEESDQDAEESDQDAEILSGEEIGDRYQYDIENNYAGGSSVERNFVLQPLALDNPGVVGRHRRPLRTRSRRRRTRANTGSQDDTDRNANTIRGMFCVLYLLILAIIFAPAF